MNARMKNNTATSNHSKIKYVIVREYSHTNNLVLHTTHIQYILHTKQKVKC